MIVPEFSRPIDVRQCEGKDARLVASAEERAALAYRFALVRIDTLEADLALGRDGQVVNAAGELRAEIVQSCAVSGEDLPVSICEPLSFRFVPEADISAEEVELDANACDEIAYAGSHIDLGEAAAQSMALAIDPFRVGPQAQAARSRAGIVSEAASGPFAALANLKQPE
jgi:hypothetical protein